MKAEFKKELVIKYTKYPFTLKRWESQYLMDTFYTGIWSHLELDRNRTPQPIATIRISKEFDEQWMIDDIIIVKKTRFSNDEADIDYNEAIQAVLYSAMNKIYPAYLTAASILFSTKMYEHWLRLVHTNDTEEVDTNARLVEHYQFNDTQLDIINKKVRFKYPKPKKVTKDKTENNE